jgi:hypothetical protein
MSLAALMRRYHRRTPPAWLVGLAIERSCQTCDSGARRGCRGVGRRQAGLAACAVACENAAEQQWEFGEALCPDGELLAKQRLHAFQGV